MPKVKAKAPPSIPGLLHESEFSRKIRKSIRCLRGWRSKRIGPAWAKMGVDVYYKDNAAQEYLQANEQEPLRSKRRAA